MRSHKGQHAFPSADKVLPIVPRQVHANNALEAAPTISTNDSTHATQICNRSEFTRSDLLLRHKRTCGQIHRCRRKACDACAKTKTKCNLQYPCAKCSSRGRECVFQNNPQKSRDGDSERSPSTSPLRSTAGSPPSTPPLSLSPPECSWQTTNRFESPCSLLLGLPDLSEFASSSSEGSSKHSTPGSEDFEIYGGFPFDIGAYENHNPTPFDDWSLLPSSSSELDPALAGDSNYFLPRSECGTPVENTNGNRPVTPPTLSLDYLHSRDEQCLVDASSAAPGIYRGATFSSPVFLPQVPLIHAPTWNIAATLPILMRIFRACGALFAKTSEGAGFAEMTLSDIVSDIMVESSRLNDSGKDFGSDVSRSQIQLVIALVLLQTIPLFHRESEGAASPNLQYHALLVAIIRQTRLIGRVKSWRAPDWTDPESLESAWIEWAEVETIKRALRLAYAYSHDSSDSTYSASWSADMEMEIELVSFPCDDALWRAPSAAEWFAVAHTPSPHGVGMSRVYGVTVQDALAALAAPSGIDSSIAVPLTSFGLFILIHAILRNIPLPHSPLGADARQLVANVVEKSRSSMVAAQRHGWSRGKASVDV
ncbi:hypothetical protein B0H14DRAFT_3480381 [Mycena olivaceomarginata]|nr:hypothetical protein B0H14DRAFT_3480381 [Mycena olivaceomarginata]